MVCYLRYTQNAIVAQGIDREPGDHPVGGVFIGLTCVYAAEFFETLGPDAPRLSRPGERAAGFFRLGTGLWLMYLVFAVALNFSVGYTLPL